LHRRRRPRSRGSCWGGGRRTCGGRTR
jgi:hypothetical protein